MQQSVRHLWLIYTSKKNDLYSHPQAGCWVWSLTLIDHSKLKIKARDVSKRMEIFLSHLLEWGEAACVKQSLRVPVVEDAVQDVSLCSPGQGVGNGLTEPVNHLEQSCPGDTVHCPFLAWLQNCLFLLSLPQSPLPVLGFWHVYFGNTTQTSHITCFLPDQLGCCCCFALLCFSCFSLIRWCQTGNPKILKDKVAGQKVMMYYNCSTAESSFCS